MLAQRADPASARVRERVTYGSPRPASRRRRCTGATGLCRGTQIVGPAIIEAMDSTTVVPPGWQARIDELGLHSSCDEARHEHSMEPVVRLA